MAKAFESCYQKGCVKDSLISQSSRQAQHLWHLREAVTETLARYQPFKNDVAVRPSRLPDFIEELDQWLAQHHRFGEAVCFGHLADGNVHINILKPEGIDLETFNNNRHKLMPELSQLIARYQGTIAAEHGIGLLKRPYLDLCRSAEANRVMRGVKAAFDPDGILNPGKVL
jgi:FAD/FMN-containing dehydrogenase